LFSQPPNPLIQLCCWCKKKSPNGYTLNPVPEHFGALSVRVQYLAESEFICDVPSSAFSPPPKVDSAVVRLRPRLLEPQANEPKHLETLVKLGFSSKRKMLRNNLKSVV
jgi:16S rRNA (adenine1518-N6/adenine1519-N6)-dimethyltransferase